MDEPTTTEQPLQSLGWIRLLGALLIVGMAIGARSIIGTVLDRPGLGVLRDGRPTVDAELAFPVDLGDEFEIAVSDNGITIAALAGVWRVGVGLRQDVEGMV